MMYTKYQVQLRDIGGNVSVTVTADVQLNVLSYVITYKSSDINQKYNRVKT